MTQIYSTDRERRLRLVLRVAQVAGWLLLVLVLMVLLFGGNLVATTIAAVSGTAIVATSFLALRRLPGRDRRARRLALAAGAVTLVVGLVYGTSPDTGILALGLIVVGVAILVLALLRDDPELTT